MTRYKWVLDMEGEGSLSDSIEVRNSDRPMERESFLQLPRIPVTGLLDNIRSAYNVGSIFRTADSARIRKLVLCGLTAYPPSTKLEKTSLGATPYVPWEHCHDSLEAVRSLRKAGVFVASLETTDKSVDYMEFEFPPEICLVLGNEIDGVSREILKESDILLEVPVWGMKNSINVASIFSIVVYDIVRHYRQRGVIDDETFLPAARIC